MNNRKIPTVLGVLLVLLMVAGLFITTSGLDRVKTFFTSASPNITPSDVNTANITNSSFSVYWTTDTPTLGAIFYGTNQSLDGGVAVDERDVSQSGDGFKTHLVKVNGLEANTKYYFKIGETEPSSAEFEVTTGPSLPPGGGDVSLTGTVEDSAGQGLDDGFATWQSPGSSKIAALVKSDGSFVLPISLARTTNLASTFTGEPGAPEKIVITGAVGEATINCQIGQVSTLPKVKIGQTINCAGGQEQAAEKVEEVVEDIEETASNEAGSFKNLLKNPTSRSTSGTTTSLNIEQGESVSTTLPTFSGKVGPKQVVEITIHSEEVYSGTVIAKPDGTWSWTPPANLSPGEHTVTITIVKADGTTQTVERAFVVTPGEPILPVTAGTPSGEISVTPVPTSGELIPSGVDTPTIVALTTGLLFTILSIGALFTL